MFYFFSIRVFWQTLLLVSKPPPQKKSKLIGKKRKKIAGISIFNISSIKSKIRQKSKLLSQLFNFKTWLLLNTLSIFKDTIHMSFSTHWLVLRAFCWMCPSYDKCGSEGRNPPLWKRDTEDLIFPRQHQSFEMTFHWDNDSSATDMSTILAMASVRPVMLMVFWRDSFVDIQL